MNELFMMFSPFANLHSDDCIRYLFHLFALPLKQMLSMLKDFSLQPSNETKVVFRHSCSLFFSDLIRPSTIEFGIINVLHNLKRGICTGMLQRRVYA